MADEANITNAVLFNTVVVAKQDPDEGYSQDIMVKNGALPNK